VNTLMKKPNGDDAMEKIEQMINCPVCGSTNISPKVKLSVRAEEAAQHFVLGEGDKERHARLSDHIHGLWKSPQCEIRTCNACELDFAWPFVAGDGVFYNLAYPHVDYPKARWEWDKTVDILGSLDTHGKRGLEIGSGFGYFLDLVSPRYFECGDMVAIEYNGVAADRLREQGFTAFAQDIREPQFDQYQGHFDYVFMFQVLEHMDNIPALFERIKLITRNGAHLFIAVPNAVRTTFNEANKSLLDMPPNHISRWSDQAFVSLAKMTGFDVLEIMQEPMSFVGFIKQDLIYSHMRRSQVSGSLSNRVRSKPRDKLRRFEEAALTLMHSPSRFAVWAKALGQQNLGSSTFVHLQRK
jgi:SAM-dependent methyltransferase